MSSPTDTEILELATRLGYRESRPSRSSTLYLIQTHATEGEKPVKIHVYFTTRSIMTLLDHPTRGTNKLWRSNAYQTLEDLQELLEDPRKHTSRGYRQADNAVRVCARCQQLKTRQAFSNNQWKVIGPDFNACKDCIAKSKRGNNSGTVADDNASVSTTGQIDNLVELAQDMLQIHEEYTDVDDLVELTEDRLRLHDESTKSKRKKNDISERQVRRQFNCPDCPKHGRGTFVFFKKVPAMKPMCKCPQCKMVTRGRCKRLYPVKVAKGYGLFRCQECNDKWGSSRAIDNVGQECYMCRGQGKTTMVTPFRLEVYKKKRAGGEARRGPRARRPRRVPVAPIPESTESQAEYTPSDRARNESGASNALLPQGGDRMYEHVADTDAGSSSSMSSHVHVVADSVASISSDTSSSVVVVSAPTSVGGRDSIPAGYQHKCAACASGACKSRRVAFSERHDVSDGNTVSTSASVVTNSSVDKQEFLDRDENFEGFEDSWAAE